MQVKLKLRAFILLSLVLLAATGVLVLTRPSRPENRLIFYENPVPWSFLKTEITLRNVTKETIAYSVKGSKASKPGIQRTLKVGTLDRFATDAAPGDLR